MSLRYEIEICFYLYPSLIQRKKEKQKKVHISEIMLTTTDDGNGVVMVGEGAQ